MSPPTNYRDLSGWRAYGLPLSTPSNRAAELFDAWQIQLHSFQNDDALGGLLETGKSILIEDPDFIFFDVMDAVNSSQSLKCSDATQKERIEKLDAICESGGQFKAGGHRYSDWEVQHCRAALLYARGFRNKAQCLWENIVAKYPLDIIALNQIFQQGIWNAEFGRVRDTLLSSLPLFNKSDPYYGYLLARTGFSVEQTGNIRRAEEMITEALQINRGDVWGIHSMAHVYESEGRCQEGDKFMSDCESEWRAGKLLAGHNWWHWALFQLDLGRTEDVLAEWEKSFLPNAIDGLQNGSFFPMSDAVSLLLRLDNEFCLSKSSLSQQWNTVIDKLMPQKLTNTGQPFYDYHLTMAIACAKRPDLLQLFKENQIEYFSEENIVTDYYRITHGVGAEVMKAFECIAEDNWTGAADILFDLRHLVWETGGSLAQRDYWNHLLVRCLWRSGDIARLKSFLTSRVMQRNRCGMSQRYLQSMVVEEHANNYNHR